VTRGEPRIRPFVPTPPPVPPACAGLPDRDTEPTATPHVSQMIRVAPGPIHVSSVPIDVHGSLDRAKDVSSFGEALVRRLPDECVRNVPPHADYVPLLILPEGTCLSSVRPPAWERAPLQTIRTDRDPRCSARPRRLTASRESGCLPPLRPRAPERIAPPVSRDGLPLTPPTHSPHGWGQRAFRALQAYGM